MSKIAFITDTNSSIPKELSDDLGIVQVPIHIMFGEETYITGKDIDDTKLFGIIDERQLLPTTAAPSPGAFHQAFQQAFDEGADQIICICCSSKVSATFDSATMAAGEFPGKDISVVDSLQLCLGEGFQVLAAVEAAKEGASKDEILAMIEDLKSRLHVYAALPTLKYLAMGGRMGKLAAGVADTFNIKPVLTTIDGKLDLLEKVRTWRKARVRLVNLGIESTKGAEITQLAMIHVNNPDGAMELYEMLKDSLELPSEPLLAEFTPGLSVHAGSGVIGFVMVTAE
jgi:DegV family protein with EDD domain